MALQPIKRFLLFAPDWLLCPDDFLLQSLPCYLSMTKINAVLDEAMRCNLCMFNVPYVFAPSTVCIRCGRPLHASIVKIWCQIHHNEEVKPSLFTDLKAAKWDDINCRNTKRWPLLVIPLLATMELTDAVPPLPERLRELFIITIERTEWLLEIREASKSIRTESIEMERNINFIPFNLAYCAARSANNRNIHWTEIAGFYPISQCNCTHLSECHIKSINKNAV